MKKSSFWILFSFLFSPLSLHAVSPTKIDPVQALKVYPLQIRNAAVVALQNPDILIQLAALQKKSSTAFKQLLSTYPKKTQDEIWEFLRNPKLVNDMAAGDKDAYKNYPKEIHPIAKDLGDKYPDLLNKIAALDDQPQKEFENIIQGLPATTQQAFRILLSHPEILNTFIQELDLSSITLEAFKKNPEPIKAKVQALIAQIQKGPLPSGPKVDWTAKPGEDPQDLAKLQKAYDSMNQNLSYEQDVDPKGKPAASMNIQFDPYPYFNPYTGMYYYPFWFGWPTMWW